MRTSRLEAFSDGVIAIIITIMVLELKVPHGADLGALSGLMPVFLSYVLSFVYVGIYWNNHHHLFQVTERVTGGILWANLHLLFWLSLFPFATAWMGENHFESLPTALYGVVLFMAAVSFFILKEAILSHEGKDSKIGKALAGDIKGNLSPVLYLVGVGLAFVNRWLADAIYVLVALMWLVPDPRIEKRAAR